MDVPCIILVFMVTLAASRLSSAAASTDDSSNGTEGAIFIIESDKSFPYTLIDGQPEDLYFNYSLTEPTGALPVGLSDSLVLQAFLSNTKIASLKGQTEFQIDRQQPSGNLSVSLEGKLPGRTTLHFQGQAKLKGGTVLNDVGDVTFDFLVERIERPIDIAFNVVVILLVVTANVGLGAKVDLDVVKSELKRPFAPIIGLCSQFIIMPLVAFTVAYNLDLDPGIALGFFALGCSPGGSASNIYTYLLNGNVSLSITMTLISTVAALGLLPAWLFTLGRVVYSGGEFKIPFQNVFFSLLGIIIPVGMGLFLQRKYPKVAKIFISAIKYITIVFIIFVLTVGVYANVYIFSLLSGEVLLAAAALPYLGFVLGGLVAFILRQGWTNVITIAVETGIQNTGIPIVLLRLSLLGPDKDTSIVAPVTSALFTPIPLCFGILYVQLKAYLKRRREAADKPEAVAVYNGHDPTDASKGSASNGIQLQNCEQILNDK